MKGEGLTSKFIGIYEYSKKSPDIWRPIFA